jgi:hypothetical protein
MFLQIAQKTRFAGNRKNDIGGCRADEKSGIEYAAACLWTIDLRQARAHVVRVV